jgi:hypothetical protein
MRVKAHRYPRAFVSPGSPPMPKPIRPLKPSAAGVKCVLLVAQEDATRPTAKWALTDFGYLVNVTRSAQEALILFDFCISSLHGG